MTEIDLLKTEISQLKSSNKTLRETINKRDKEIDHLVKQLQQREKTIRALEKTIEDQLEYREKFQKGLWKLLINELGADPAKITDYIGIKYDDQGNKQHKF